jgi:putative chitinase
MPTETQLLKLFPSARRDVVREILGGIDYFRLADITTVPRMAMFLAQFGHETRNLRSLTEDLNYSAARMAEVWPHRYAVVPDAEVKTPNALALTLAHNPEAFANATYGKRMGNTKPSDGWTYRGRGFGLTGRDGYREAGKRVDQPFEGHPDLVATPYGAFLSGIGVWIWKGLNGTADRQDVTGNTRILNGGLIGLNDRRMLFGLAVVLLRG